MGVLTETGLESTSTRCAQNSVQERRDFDEQDKQVVGYLGGLGSYSGQRVAAPARRSGKHRRFRPACLPTS